MIKSTHAFAYLQFTHVVDGAQRVNGVDDRRAKRWLQQTLTVDMACAIKIGHGDPP